MSPSSWPPDGIHVMIKPAGANCNLACKYCFYLPKEHLYPTVKHKPMTTAVLERFTRQYLRVQKVPEVTFGWQGGEPTLMGLDFFKTAVAIQQKHAKPGLKISNAFQTNATLVTDEWAKFFHENNFLLGVSIDGPRELHDTYRVDKAGHGTFDRVMKGIELLKKHHVEFNILACVHAMNVDHPLKVYKFFRDEMGVEFIQFIPIVERKRDEFNKETSTVTTRSVSGAQWGRFLNTIFDEWVRNDVGKVFVQLFDVTLGAWFGQPGGVCSFAPTCGFALALEHNGDLYACDHYVNSDNFRGNVMKTPLATLVGSKEQHVFGLQKQDALPPRCKACKWRFACHGECPKNRVVPVVDGEQPLNHLCEGYEAFFTHVDPYMKFMAEELKHRRPAASVMAWGAGKVS